MGAALAMLAALAAPERIQGLLLVAPAGLPIRKPVHRSFAALGMQLLAGTYPLSDVVMGTRDLVSAPRCVTRLARTLRGLDLTSHMERVRSARIPTTVVACTTDTLVPPRQCRSVARLLGADYREVATAGGRVWMFKQPLLLAQMLGETASGQDESTG